MEIQYKQQKQPFLTIHKEPENVKFSKTETDKSTNTNIQQSASYTALVILTANKY